MELLVLLIDGFTWIQMMPILWGKQKQEYIQTVASFYYHFHLQDKNCYSFAILKLLHYLYNKKMHSKLFRQKEISKDFSVCLDKSPSKGKFRRQEFIENFLQQPAIQSWSL